MSTHMHIHTYASIYIHTHTHICTCIYPHVSTHIHTCSHIYGTHMHSLRLLHIHIVIHTCIHMYPHTHVTAQMHIHTYIHMHTHASLLPWFDLHYLQIFLQPFCTPSFLCVWKNSMWQVGYAHWFCVYFLITAQWSQCCYHNALLFQVKRKSSRKRAKDSVPCVYIPSTLELG